MSTGEGIPLINKASICSSKNANWHKNKDFHFNLIRRCLAEFVGTALYMFAGISSVSNFVGNNSPHLPTVALTFGFAYAGLSGAALHVSGGHLNPAVTLGVFIAGGINIIAAILYWLAQIVGSIAGSVCVLAYEQGVNFNLSYIEGPSDSNVSHQEIILLKYAATLIKDGSSPAAAILVEMLLTMMFIMVFIHTSMEKPELRSTSPALSGLTLAAGILSRLTGGSLNPARSFGPAVVGGDNALWKHHYVYWIGPLLGGLIAGGVYRLILSSKPLVPLAPKETNKTNCDKHIQFT